jgi:hypothetical protein
MSGRTAALCMAAALLPMAAAAQTRAAVARERTDFAAWLAAAATSPLRAVTVRPIGALLTLGPSSADVPMEGAEASELMERDGRVWLKRGQGEVPVGRGRAVALGGWRMVVGGIPGRSVVTIYAGQMLKPPHLVHYPYNIRTVDVVALRPAAEPRSQRILAPDGTEVEATDAGTVLVTRGGPPRTLRVMRLPGATEDESDLEIYFRDGTAGNGTYPAGRFVSLIPRPDGRYTLDWNRARNPFCAYNTVYPCPAPWRGNTFPEPVRAGERYRGGGLEVTVP